MLLYSWLLLIICLPAGCQKNSSPTTTQPYRINGRLAIDGLTRTYLLNLPPGYYIDSTNYALVIGLHGLGGSALQFERDYAFTQKAGKENFIVVYPEGVAGSGILALRSWNAGSCCDEAMYRQIDDVKFISQLITTLTSRYNIDGKRIYITGMSNGAMMAYRLACELPDKIAAIAPVSGTLLTTQPCQPGKQVAVLHIHSLADTKVPYKGGKGLAGYYFAPVDSGLHVWQVNDICLTAPVQQVYPTYTITEWSNQQNKVFVSSYITTDGGHAWPGGLKSTSRADTPSTAFVATDVIWNFFRQHRLN